MTFLTRLRRALSGPSGRSLIKLTVYAAACLVVLAALVGRITDRPLFGGGTSYEAVLPDANGLFRNDAVKVAGVAVGHVTGIEVDHGLALVRFRIDDGDVRLTDTTRTGLRWRNVLGQKYLYLYPDEGTVLEEGSRLPVANAVASAEVGALLDAVAPVLRAIDPHRPTSSSGP